MPRAHRRFELLDVVLDDLPIGRCTIDHWEDDRGDVQWSARVLMARTHGTTSGRLMGRTREGEYVAGLEAAGFVDVSVEFTHEVADGMHGAIVKAVKTSQPEAKELPVIRPAAKAGCC